MTKRRRDLIVVLVFVVGLALGAILPLVYLMFAIQTHNDLSAQMVLASVKHDEEIFRLRDFYLGVSRWNYYRGWYDYCRLYSDTEAFEADCLERAEIGAESDMFNRESTGFDFPFPP